MELTSLEKIALQGLVARERDIQEKLLTPLQRDFQEVIKGIESRLGIVVGEIGTKYLLDLESGSITAKESETSAAETNI